MTSKNEEKKQMAVEEKKVETKPVNAKMEKYTPANLGEKIARDYIDDDSDEEEGSQTQEEEFPENQDKDDNPENKATTAKNRKKNLRKRNQRKKKREQQQNQQESQKNKQALEKLKQLEDDFFEPTVHRVIDLDPEELHEEAFDAKTSLENNNIKIVDSHKIEEHNEVKTMMEKPEIKQVKDYIEERKPVTSIKKASFDPFNLNEEDELFVETNFVRVVEVGEVQNLQ
jgi:hypothetical protein